MSAYQVGEPVELRHYVIPLVWTIVGILILYHLIRKKKVVLMTGILGCFLVFQYFGSGIRYEINRQITNNTRMDGGYTYVKEMEEKGEKLPKQIYCYDGSDRVDHQIFYGYQFVLNRYEIIPAFEKDGSDIPDGAMVFTNVPMGKEFTERGFKEKKLDSNEYLYRYAD